MNIILNDSPLLYMLPTNIITLITERMSHRQEKKDLYGEVFTPIELIDELVSHIPINWTNSNTFILDPASGIGNFTIVIYYKLMNSLSHSIPNETERSRHIIENMLYMIEIDKSNVSYCRNIFRTIHPTAKPNIFCGDFLKDEDKWKTVFAIPEWDIIVANPPYQSKQTHLREGGYGGKTLWDQFLSLSLDLLNPVSGYLAFITPPGWRKPDAELYQKMTQDNDLHYLHIYGKRAGQQWFKVQQRFDIFVIGKSPSKKPTEIVDENGETHMIETKEWPFIPNYAFNSIKKILTEKEKGIQVIYDRSSYGTDMKHMRPHKNTTYKYPVVHSMNRKGIVYWYSNTKDRGHFGEPKVLLNFNEKLYPVLDEDGTYGMSQFTFGIPVRTKKEGCNILKALETPAFREIVKATKWGAFRTDWRMFSYFKPHFWKHFSREKKTRKA